MQTIEYVNLLGERAVFGSGPPFVLKNVKGTEPTANLRTNITALKQDGESLYSLRKRHREVDITFLVHGRDRADMYHKRRELCGVLARQKAYNDKTRESAKLFYENDSGKWWTPAVPEAGLDFTRRMKHFNYDIPLTFYCPSAYWISQAQSSVVLAFSGEGFSFPFAFPIHFGSREFVKEAWNQGQGDAPVEIEIIGMGETPVRLNHTTGARIALTQPLPQGRILKINTAPEKLSVTITDADGVTVNAFGVLDPESSLTDFTLRPGRNELEYTPGGTAAQSRITVKWYTLFEGV